MSWYANTKATRRYARAMVTGIAGKIMWLEARCVGGHITPAMLKRKVARLRGWATRFKKHGGVA